MTGPSLRRYPTFSLVFVDNVLCLRFQSFLIFFCNFHTNHLVPETRSLYLHLDRQGDRLKETVTVSTESDREIFPQTVSYYRYDYRSRDSISCTFLLCHPELILFKVLDIGDVLITFYFGLHISLSFALRQRVEIRFTSFTVYRFLYELHRVFYYLNPFRFNYYILKT